MSGRSGRLETRDIEEQHQASSPLDVRHCQLTPGPFFGWTNFVQINGILFYRQGFSKRVAVDGATPPGFFVFGGSSPYRVPVNVCGADVNRETLVYTQASTEIDFVVPDDSDHWVILVPHDRLLGRLDPEFRLAVLRQCHRHMTCSPALAHTLRQFVCHVIDKFARQPELLTDEWVCKSIESQLLHMLVRMMRLGHGIADTATVLDHQSTLRDVIAVLKGRKQPVTVPDLAVAVKLSQRQLERDFRNALGITPKQYLQRVRMNGARNDLRAAESGFSTVTEIGNDWGFSELGRFAVEYKTLFGESPSKTLRRPAVSVPIRLADALSENDCAETHRLESRPIRSLHFSGARSAQTGGRRTSR